MTLPETSPVVRVAGSWELGWNTPIKEVDLWEMMLRDFAVERWYMEPVSGIVGHDVHEVASLESLLADHRTDDFPIVFVDENGACPLSEFQHPDNALYVFGKASFSPMRALQKSGDLSVRIETPAQNALLWPHQAAAIILYHRMRLWQRP